MAVFLGATAQGLDEASAHTTEQAFVLLLPTGIYTTAGVVAVALSGLVLALPPASASARLFAAKPLFRAPTAPLATPTSLVSLALLIVLILAGFTATRDPLGNPLPLFIWTVWWIGFVILQALVGDLWRWLNPWTGLYRLFFANDGAEPPIRLPGRVGRWPGVITFLAFGAFALADPAPNDPARLATVVALYWFYTFVGMALFGETAWLSRCECFTMLLRHFASLSAFGPKAGGIRFGLPGWRLVDTPALSLSGGLFVIFILGTGSFDGLNETFWWLDQIGINPLEFPGRSAVIWPTVIGLIVANFALAAVFALMVGLGLRLAKADMSFRQTFGTFALAIPPIALGYHIAHYLTAFLVQGQYTLAAANDPWSNGSNYLGLAGFHVTTGFLNTRDSVEIIWLAQAGAVVLGHILSVLLTHALAMRIFKDREQALLGQLPLATFMVCYTALGLWLLAAPRGA